MHQAKQSISSSFFLSVRCAWYQYENFIHLSFHGLASATVTDSFEDDFTTLMTHGTSGVNFKWSTNKVRCYHFFVKLELLEFWRIYGNVTIIVLNEVYYFKVFWFFLNVTFFILWNFWSFIFKKLLLLLLLFITSIL